MKKISERELINECVKRGMTPSAMVWEDFKKVLVDMGWDGKRQITRVFSPDDWDWVLRQLEDGE